MIEDNPADVALMLEAIRWAKFTDQSVAKQAHNVDAGWNLLESCHESGHPFHIILMDLNLPRVNGKELIPRIKGDKRFAHISLFIVSNSDNAAEIAECMRRGADSYMQKPSDFMRLADFFRGVKYSWETQQQIIVDDVLRVYGELDSRP